MTNICVWGDSISYGAKDLKKGGWVNRLNLHLSKKTNYETIVYNLSVDGEDSEGLLKRFNSECKIRKPNIIIIAIGVNDSGHRKNKNIVSFEQYEKNINKLIEISLKYSKEILFIGLTKVNEKKTKPVLWEELYYDNKQIEKYDKKLKEIVKNNKLRYVPMNKIELCEDGVHPNEKGHEKKFEVVKSYLKV